MLSPVAPGIEIREAASYRLCFPRIEGETLAGIFVRVDPETGKYRDPKTSRHIQFVILSGVNASQSEASAESKDPSPVCATTKCAGVLTILSVPA
jgi:hypothetical protein